MSSAGLLSLDNVEKSYTYKSRYGGQASTLLLGILIGLGAGVLLVGVPSERVGSGQQAIAMDALLDGVQPQPRAPANAASGFRSSWNPADSEVKVEDEEEPGSPLNAAGEKDDDKEIMKQLEAEPWHCHMWDATDISHPNFKDESKQDAICEMHRGHGYDYKFTKGDDKAAPGCDGCWCCRREVDHAAAVKHEEEVLLAELTSHEQSCLKKNNETTYKATTEDKFPCLQAEATKFFKTLETEGQACVSGSEGMACMFDEKKMAEEALKAQAQAEQKDNKLAEETKLGVQKLAGLKVKKSQYTNPFSVPKEALRRPAAPLPA